MNSFAQMFGATQEGGRAPDATDPFEYIDTAIGGAQNRNNVMRSSQFRPNGKSDVYTTYRRFTEDLPEYMGGNPNPKGRPSVSGYNGPCRAPFFPIDIDVDGDLDTALQATRRVLYILKERYEVPLEALRIYYSGNKGFHVLVPESLFGGFGVLGAQTSAARFKALIAALLPSGDALPFDPAIYDAMRLLRAPNTLNSKSGRYKVPLTAIEVMRLTPEQVMECAQTTRDVDTTDADEWGAISTLIELWESTAQHQPRQRGESIAASDDEPITVNRNVTLTSIGGKLRYDGLSHRAIEAALLVTNEERCQPPLDDDEVCMIAVSVARYPAGTLPPPPQDLAEAQHRARRSAALQSATLTAMAHRRAHKYVPVATSLAAELTRLKEQGKAPDTEDGLYHISKYTIGGYDRKTGEWRIAESTVRNHMRDLRNFASHIPGFHAGLRPINFPKGEVDPETGEVTTVDRFSDTWCYSFDGDPAHLVAALPYLPYPEDGRGRSCKACGAEKKSKTVEFCPYCEVVEVMPKSADGVGANFAPYPADATMSPEDQPDEGGERVLSPLVPATVLIPTGGSTRPPLGDADREANFAPSPQAATVETEGDPWDRLYERAAASTRELARARPAPQGEHNAGDPWSFLSEVEPREDTPTPTSDTPPPCNSDIGCLQQAYCTKHGKCRWTQRFANRAA